MKLSRGDKRRQNQTKSNIELTRIHHEKYDCNADMMKKELIRKGKRSRRKNLEITIPELRQSKRGSKYQGKAKNMIFTLEHVKNVGIARSMPKNSGKITDEMRREKYINYKGKK